MKNRKWQLVSVVLAAILGALSTEIVTRASNTTVTLTAGQDTYTINNLIPTWNTDLCAFYNASPCTSAQVVTKGCVAVPLSSVTKTSPVFRSCTVYSLDTAGVQAFVADQAALKVTLSANQEINTDIEASCAAYKLVSTTIKNNICTEISRPSGCLLCR